MKTTLVRSFTVPAWLLVACLSALPGTVIAAPAEMQLGLQAWTFRASSFYETVEKAEALGIRFLQAYPGQRLGTADEPVFHHNMSAEQRTKALAHLKAHQVILASYGVVKPKNEAEWRQVFAFAQAMGIRQIVCEPTPEALPLVDQLALKSGVQASIHNHPRPTYYADPATALAAVAPYGPELGICADTGHWVRGGFDPVESLRHTEGRIHCLHFKDLSAFGERSAHDVPWGTGVSHAAGQMAELRRQKFDGVVYVEYEHLTPNLDAEVALCVDYFQRTLAAVRQDR
jgi:sugar phosphate isomerase/epimerase